MMKNKKIALAIIIYFITAFFVNALPFVETPNISAVISILFLDFSSFANFDLIKFSPQHIIIFLICIYIICIRMLSVVNENISFKSMFMLKYTRLSFLSNIVKENIKFFSTIYMTMLMMIILLTAVLYQNFQETDIYFISIFCIYLLRFIFIIFILNLIYTILAINGEKLNFIPLVLVGFVFLIFIDLYSGSSLITYSNNASYEIIYAIFEVAIMTGLYLYIQKKFINKEDLFND